MMNSMRQSPWIASFLCNVPKPGFQYRTPERLRGGDIRSSLDENLTSLALGPFIFLNIGQRRFPVLNCRLLYSGDDGYTQRLLIFNAILSIGKTVPAKLPTFITFFSYSERVSPGAKSTSRTQSRKKCARSKTASVWATLRPMHARGPVPNMGTSSSDTPSHLDGLNRPGFSKMFGLRTSVKLRWEVILDETGPMTHKYWSYQPWRDRYVSQPPRLSTCLLVAVYKYRILSPFPNIWQCFRDVVIHHL